MSKKADLFIIIVCSLVLVPLALFTSGALRIVFSLSFVLFFPGYTLIAALFPSKGRLDGIERVALSFGLSLAVVPLIGLVLNFTPWGIRFEPILFSLLGFILAMSAVALYRRAKLLPEELFAVDFVISLSRLTTNWKRQGRWDKLLIVLLTVAVIGTIGTVAYAIETPRASEKFTEFYILGPGGKAQDYPREIILGMNSCHSCSWSRERPSCSLLPCRRPFSAAFCLRCRSSYWCCCLPTPPGSW